MTKNQFIDYIQERFPQFTLKNEEKDNYVLKYGGHEFCYITDHIINWRNLVIFGTRIHSYSGTKKTKLENINLTFVDKKIKTFIDTYGKYSKTIKDYKMKQRLYNIEMDF